MIVDNIVQGRSVRSAVSQKFKANMTGIKEKFDPLNIAKAITGGSDLAPAMLGKLTGRSKKDIAHFTNRKVTDTASQIVGQGSGDMDGSAVAVLQSIYSFLVKSRADDIKKRELERDFREEKQNEEERRHQDFLDILKEFTGGQKTATLVENEKSSEGGGLFGGLINLISSIADKIASIGEFLKSIQWITALKKFSSILFGVFRFFLFNPIGVGLLLGATLLSLLAMDENPEATTQVILNSNNDAALSTAITQQQETNISPEEIRKKDAIRMAFLKDAPFLVKHGGVGMREYMAKKGLSEAEITNLLDYKTPLYIPEKLKDVDPALYRKLKGSEKTPVLSTIPAANNTDTGKTTAPATTSATASPEPTATPAPQQPMSARIAEVIKQNQNMKLDDSISTGETVVAPSSTTNNVNTSNTNQPTPTAATQRDDTAILEHIHKKIQSAW